MVPGIIFMVYWIFAFFILYDQRLGIKKSLGESKRIVRGRWWRTFGIFLLIGLIVTAVSGVLNNIPLIGWIASMVLVHPFFIIFFKNFYLNMKEISSNKRSKSKRK